MSDVALVPLTWIRTGAAVAAVVIAGVFCLGRCGAPDPAPLPPKVQAAVTRHAIQSAVDSSEIKHLAAERDRTARALAAQIAITRQTEVVALQYQHAADTLQKVAIAAFTAVDSARGWHAAYDARSHEAEQLRLENTQKDSSLAVARLQAAVADSVSLIWAGHAARSDSLNAELLPLAMQADRCRILYVLRCPTRSQAVAGGVIAGVVGSIVIRSAVGALQRR